MKTSSTPALINVSVTAEDLRRICYDIASELNGDMHDAPEDGHTATSFKRTLRAWRAYSPFYTARRVPSPYLTNNFEGDRAMHDESADL